MSCFFPLQYTNKEEVVLWMNTVGPYHNRQETYKYFSLPFCVGTKKTISHYHETLGEALQGVELEFSGLDIKFKGNQAFLRTCKLSPHSKSSQVCFPGRPVAFCVEIACFLVSAWVPSGVLPQSKYMHLRWIWRYNNDPWLVSWTTVSCHERYLKRKAWR